MSREVRVFQDSSAAGEIVDLAAEDATSDLQSMVEGVQINKALMGEAIQDITAKVQERFPDVKFGIVYNDNPDDKAVLYAYLYIYTEGKQKEVRALVYTLVRTYENLSIYPRVNERPWGAREAA